MIHTLHRHAIYDLGEIGRGCVAVDVAARSLGFEVFAIVGNDRARTTSFQRSGAVGGACCRTEWARSSDMSNRDLSPVADGGVVPRD